MRVPAASHRSLDSSRARAFAPPAMLRRLSALACVLALLAALFVAALHHHDGAAASTASDSGCMYCAGGMTAAREPEIVPAVERLWLNPVVRAHAAPPV